MAPFFCVPNGCLEGIMKLRLLLVAITLLLNSCSFWGKHKRLPAQAVKEEVDLVEAADIIINAVATRGINPQNCSEELDKLITFYSEAPSALDLVDVKNRGQEILDKSFEARLALHSMLDILPKECKSKLKQVYLKMRMTDDFVGVHHYPDKQISADTIKYQEQPVPVYEPEAYRPFHVGKGIDASKKFEFKNGDIMITKGISFVSSTISELAAPKSLFSHIVFVHVDEKTKEVTTIESYVGRGVSIFPIDEALKNENARILVLRAKDQALASKAADYMFEKVQSLKAKKKFIPYDYELNFADNTRLSCEEVAYDSFKQVSGGSFVVPEIESEITLNDAKFLKRVGVKKGPMMVPTDMETDSRFEIVLDWTDYRVLRDSWRKDALLGEMFRWIDQYEYRIYENTTSIAAKVIWSTRYIPGVWGMMSKISGIPKDFTKDVPSLTISTMASLKGIGGPLLKAAKTADEEFFAKNGRWMTSEELRSALDEYRKTDPKDMRKVFREK
jgi:hypothetical protein